jgi:hypothetical protein
VPFISARKLIIQQRTERKWQKKLANRYGRA